MKHIHIYIYLILSLLLAGCQDEFPGKFAPVGEGTAELSVTLTYEAEEDVELKSRYEGGDPGDAIQNIKTLHMLIYDDQGALYKHYAVIDDAGNHSPEIENLTTPKLEDNREPGSTSDDDRTGRVSFDLSLKSGRYFIYAVANVPDFTQYADRYATRSGLKGITFDWDSETTENNSQMFGIFALGDPDRKKTDDAPLAVRRTDSELWCYVKRLASKVTVAFDGSQLFDNVEIYITDITVKDIAKRCALGIKNEPGKKADGTWHNAKERYDIANGLLPSGKTQIVQKLPDDRTQIVPEAFYHVCNGKHTNLGLNDENANNDDIHSQDAPALYFYENCQGTGKSKLQDANGDDEVDFPEGNDGTVANGWKDQKPYGTYIEVKGHYRCTRQDGRVGYGPITYRFMLGQNVTDNYDVLRNQHYRLTLVFKGYGNEADWHIVYNEPTGIYSSSPQYISYLYLKEMSASIKVVGEMLGGIEAHIMCPIENGRNDLQGHTYEQFGEDPLYSKLTAAQKAKDDSVRMAQTYWRPWGVTDALSEHLKETFPDPRQSKNPSDPAWGYEDGGQPFYYEGFVPNDGPWNSFLSLNKIMAQRVEPEGFDTETNKTSEYDVKTRNAYYWRQNGLGDRTYIRAYSDSLVVDDDNKGNYRVTVTRRKKDKAKTPIECVYSVPMFTRGNVLVGASGYVGNNPYESFPRKATVRFAVKVKDPDRGAGAEKYEVVYVDMIQVRRVTNPKGIMLPSNSSRRSFHVRLSVLRKPEDKRFTVFKSDGAWSAEIVRGGQNIISLSNTPEGLVDGGRAQYYVNRIEGDSECPVDFNINFNGGGDGFAIVKVRYHNYTCEHDIFVCRGYNEPVELEAGKGKWSTRNVKCFNGITPVLVETPLDEGSMFRHDVYVGIARENTPKTVDKYFQKPGSLSVYLPDNDGKLTTEGWEWKDLEYYNEKVRGYRTPDRKSWPITGNSEGKRIAKAEDYYECIPVNLRDVDYHIKRAYGILYGDGTDEVELDVEKATGYGRVEGAVGIRGVFVYNASNSKFVFFPIGSTGYGRRKANIGGWAPAKLDDDGVMRYASRTRLWTCVKNDGLWNKYEAHSDLPSVIAASSTLKTLQYKPLFYDLYRRFGALYWCGERHEPSDPGCGSASDPNILKASKSSTIDINYHTMGFEGITNQAVAYIDSATNKGSEACFIRTIGY